MKSLLLKLDENQFEKLERSAKALKTSKTNLIKQALEHYERLITKKRLELQIQREVQLIKEYKLDADVVNAFSDISLTDLQKHLDED